ncbi:MAG TPA: non-ribosomal peptide synthetase, partial [Elainellaceae cyanobacterium]
AGGTIVIPDPDESKNPAHWAELMTQQQVTIWNSVPALMQMLVEYSIGSSSLFSQSLRLVLLSGDWIPLTLPNQVRSLCQDIELVSLGGATEASIWSILYPIEQIDSSWKSIPYGRPMDNQRFYVLNEMLEACPTWVPGQLYIGGIGLAKGYWQDEEKTQASFLVHPQTQERLYKTGDLGCYLPDGNIEFLGREDFQVKLNGYRIELGEIEAIIDSHPVVQKSLILAMGEQHNSRQLVAFIVMNQAHKADDLSSEVRQEDVVNKLRAFLYGRLPEYMVPSMFKCLDALPLSSNGKIDRKALSKIAISQKSETNHILPYTMFERTLANIFRQVVQIENIGIYDNFFELGANSIHIVQIHGKIREIIKKDIPVTEIFRYPTINSLDEYLSNICDDEKSSHHSLGRAQSRKKHMKTRQERR